MKGKPYNAFLSEHLDNCKSKVLKNAQKGKLTQFGFVVKSKEPAGDNMDDYSIDQDSNNDYALIPDND